MVSTRVPLLHAPCLIWLSTFLLSLGTPAIAVGHLTDEQLSKIEANLADGAHDPWELGTRAQAVTELHAPSFSVFSNTKLPVPSSEFKNGLPAGLDQVLEIAHDVVANRSVSNGGITGPQPLVANGAAGDPASIGVAVLVANWTLGPNGGDGKYGGQDYAGAAKDQLDFLLGDQVPKTDDGAISHRTEQVQLWSDFVYMVPPFLAYYGVTTGNQTLLKMAYDQCRLYRKYLLDPEAGGMWKHILLGDWDDQFHWTTGNGWAAAGMLRVLATIQHSEYADALKSEQADLANWVSEIHDGIYPHLQLNGIFKNYPDANATGNFDDAAGATILAASVYRLASVWGVETHIADAERSRAALLGPNLNVTNTDSKFEHFTSDFWLTPVVLPYDFHQLGKHSPEAQAFVLEMEAGRNDWLAGKNKRSARAERMHKNQTLSRARALLHVAKARTGPGSGHELGDGAPGLPAVCAYLASLELNNGDVNEKIAHNSSCLAPKIFTNVVNVVRIVLAESDLEARLKEVKYEDLMASHKVLRGDLVLPWLREAEALLLQSGQVRVKNHPDDVLVKCAVFYWTSQLLGLVRIKRPHLTRPHAIDPDEFDDLLLTIDDVCLSIRDRITAEVARLREEAKKNTAKTTTAASSSAKKQTKPKPPKPSGSSAKKQVAKEPSPATASTSKSPSKSALKRTLPTPSVAEPDASPSKRRVSFMHTADLADTLPQTPSKRRRVAATPTSGSMTSQDEASALSAPSPTKLPGLNLTGIQEDVSEQTTLQQPTPVPPAVGSATPRRSSRLSQPEPETPASEVVEDGPRSSDEEQDDREKGLSRSRQFRCPFLDRRQWYRRDPKIEREWKMAEAFKQRMVDARGHPFARLRPAQFP
ncbi:hypothetical protein GLOTRDRAFT_141133 [Gloeophyllum trabeum ATCC 11539]|uniref:Six-hairpin glycosidase n=1 Tax=Gloeophyllum trabeum (strain ATCC 11539 / FP-39264 / Madison 617) TaxID=670483 RepID=S7PU48_GLOTA|nr:uncharacterized protein GLOTRDRAFT_141133 [Gloeophyllum trabeum ATCC 11539]EPQ50968.1 hypothetical protein GLOTRDRAFT_141133 [Gloeophyllum trabeum ATCC 11539]